MNFSLYVFLLTFFKQTDADVTYGTCETEYDDVPSTDTTFEDTCPGKEAGFDDLKINYLDYPPYIFADGQPESPKGIWVDFLINFTTRACGGSPSTVKWVQQTNNTARELGEFCRDNSFKCAMAIPSVGRDGALFLNRNDWTGYWSIHGIAFVTIPGEVWRTALSDFGQAIIDSWPLFVVCLIACIIAGSVMWLLDTWSNEDEFPRPYFNGIWHGFWCAYVSMTTVGYGDKAPRSVVARIFAVIWIVVGISMIASLTSLLSNALTNALYQPEVKFTGKLIGCLGTVPMAKETIAKNGGRPKIAQDYLELESWMARGLIEGFAMDSRQLQYYYKTRLSKLHPEVKFRLENVYTYEKVYGLSAFKPHSSTTGTHWDDCMKKYIETNSDRQSEMEGFYTEPLMADMLDPSILQENTSRVILIDPNSDFFFNLLWGALGIIVGIFLIGMLFEYTRRSYFGTAARRIGMRGLSFNNGYTTNGERRVESDDRKLTKEERNLQEAVERTSENADRYLQETQRSIHNEIMEMSRSVRREMIEIKRSSQKRKEDYGL